MDETDMLVTTAKANCIQCQAIVEVGRGFELVARETGVSVLFCSLRCVIDWCLDAMTAGGQPTSVRAPVGTLIDTMREVDREQRKQKTRENTAQRSTIAGAVFQLLAPNMSDFPYNPLDCVPLRGPIDWLVYDGLTGGHLERLVFLENKLGGSQLTPRQRQVKRVISALCQQCSELVCFDVYSRNLPLIAPRRTPVERPQYQPDSL